MTRRLPPLNALKAFESAARQGSFRLAADTLHVTHGAISRQVQQLEEWLGVALFVRQGRRVELTAAGQAYLPTIQTAFDQIASATEKLVARAQGRRLRINVTPTLAMHWLLPRLTRFQLRYPGVELRLATSDAAINNQNADFDIAIRRGQEHWRGFVAHAFLTERELPVCSPALLERQPISQAEDLAHHTLLHSETRPVAWERWLAAAGVPALQPAATQHFDHYYLALQAAIDGLGITLGPLPVIEDELASGKLVAPLTGPEVTVKGYCWVVPQSLVEDELVSAFCTWLEEEAAKS
ncbi:MAG: transcriptional regulator GcvA [Pseudogulbenkiania sp.]|nr:transcriptional regulator GcvA [Pseudogulbenkiania sp.]